MDVRTVIFLAASAARESGADALAEEEPSAIVALIPYLVITIFVAIVIALLLSIFAQSKSQFKGGVALAQLGGGPGGGGGGAAGAVTPDLETAFKQLGNKANPEQMMALFSQELEKRVTKTAQELESKYSTALEEKERELEVANHEFNIVKEKHEQAVAEKKHTEALVHSISEGLIVVNDKGEVQLLNPAAQKLLGDQDKQGIIGSKLNENLGEEQLVSMLTGSSGDKERDIELQSQNDATKKVVRASSAVIEDESGKTIGMVSVLSDITARKESEEALRASEERLRRIIETNADGMLVVDKEGITRFHNQAAEALFDRPASELLGMPCGFPVGPDERKELNIAARDGTTRVAEMHSVDTQWEGEDAFLVTLRDVTETVRMREELQRLSLSDELTGIYNRRGFTTLADQQLRIAKEAGKGPIVVFADLDKMKEINDSLGHPEGDRALKAVAQALQQSFRASDIIGRIGGDEFAVLVVDPPERGETLLEEVERNMNVRNAMDNRQYDLTVSVGFTRYDPAQPCMIDDLLKQADEAMYEQKRAKHGLA